MNGFLFDVFQMVQLGHCEVATQVQFLVHFVAVFTVQSGVAIVQCGSESLAVSSRGNFVGSATESHALHVIEGYQKQSYY